jgi:hypothetical protein
MGPVLSLGKVFGGRRLRLEWRSLLGRPLEVRFSPSIISERSLEWMGSRWIILIHCGVTNALWNAVLSCLGLSWVMPRSVKELMACWCSGGRTRSAVVWKMIHLCLMWCIWRERNARCFEDLARSFEEIVHYFLFTLYTWTAGWLDPLVVSFSDFLSRLSSPS